jgi:hypothetical protein
VGEARLAEESCEAQEGRCPPSARPGAQRVDQHREIRVDSRAHYRANSCVTLIRFLSLLEAGSRVRGTRFFRRHGTLRYGFPDVPIIEKEEEGGREKQREKKKQSDPLIDPQV